MSLFSAEDSSADRELSDPGATPHKRACYTFFGLIIVSLIIVCIYLQVVLLIVRIKEQFFPGDTTADSEVTTAYTTVTATNGTVATTNETVDSHS